jgi:hypothetical protein
MKVDNAWPIRIAFLRSEFSFVMTNCFITREAMVLVLTISRYQQEGARVGLPKALLLMRAEFWQKSVIESPKTADIIAFVGRNRCTAIKSHEWRTVDIWRFPKAAASKI